MTDSPMIAALHAALPHCVGCGKEHEPARMNVPGGPRCGCGEMSEFEDGTCWDCRVLNDVQHHLVRWHEHKLRALTFLDSECKVWVVVLVDHNLITQGSSRAEALESLESALELNLDWAKERSIDPSDLHRYLYGDQSPEYARWFDHLARETAT